MPAVGGSGQEDICLALFKDAEHGIIAGNAFDGLRDDSAAFIADQPWMNAAALQLGHQLRAAVTGPFLRAGGGEIHVIFRHEALLQHLLHGLEEGHDGAFGIRRAPAPDLAVGDIPGKGCVNPFALRRNHILMAHEHEGLFGRDTLPEKQQIAVDFRLFQMPVHEGKELFEQPVKGQELLPLIRIGH